jgi:hypothetical protein
LHLFGSIIGSLGLALGLCGGAVLRKLLGIREEFWSTGNILPEGLWNHNTLDSQLVIIVVKSRNALTSSLW